VTPAEIHRPSSESLDALVEVLLRVAERLRRDRDADASKKAGAA
jgi:hypothetical protein